MLEIEKMGMRSCSLLRLYPSKATTFEMARRGGGLEHDLGFRALTTIRLVNKHICCSASKLVFRNIHVAFRDLDGSEALMRLEDISNSPWATDARKPDMWFCPQFFEGMDRHSGEFHDFFNKLRSLFKRLPNLEAFNLYPGAFDRQYEAFFNVAVRTVRSLPLRNPTGLEISHHYYGYFHDPEEFHPMEPDSETPRGGLENLRHLGLKGRFLWENDGDVEFGQLIRTAVNIDRSEYSITAREPCQIHFISSTRVDCDTYNWGEDSFPRKSSLIC